MNETGQKTLTGLNHNIKRQCRICLESNDQQDIISPCKCRGTVQYIHQKCLMTWIKTSVTKQEPNHLQDNIYYIKCQMCKVKIPFSMQKAFVCKSKQEINNKFYQRPLFYSIYIIIYFCMIGMISYLSYIYSMRNSNSNNSQGQQSNQKPKPWMWTIMAILIGVLALLTVKVTYDLLNDFVVKLKRTVGRLQLSSFTVQQ